MSKGTILCKFWTSSIRYIFGWWEKVSFLLNFGFLSIKVWKWCTIQRQVRFLKGCICTNNFASFFSYFISTNHNLKYCNRLFYWIFNPNQEVVDLKETVQVCSTYFLSRATDIGTAEDRSSSAIFFHTSNMNEDRATDLLIGADGKEYQKVIKRKIWANT